MTIQSNLTYDISYLDNYTYKVLISDGHNYIITW